MLKEVKNIKQDSEVLNKRWFSDDYFDLIIWEDEKGEIATFQLCYDKNKNEHAFYWVKGKEITHHKVDDGELSGRIKQTPLLLADGEFKILRILKEFKERSSCLKTLKTLEKKIYISVLKELMKILK